MAAKISYLAAPYSGTEEEINSRMEEFYRIDAELMSKGYFTVSPLLKHATLPYGNLPGNWDYWEEYSRALLSRCDEMIIITLSGWSTSNGVLGEMSICRELGIPFRFFDPETREFS